MKFSLLINAGICIVLGTFSSMAAWVSSSSSLTSGKSFPGGFTGVAGCAANRLTGEVYLNCIDNGLWKSGDKGATWTKMSGTTVGGRGESGCAVTADQDNPIRVAVFSLDGAAGWTNGTTWKKMADNGRNWDFGSVDWSSANPTTIIAAKHESGNQVYLSTNGGTSWNLLSGVNVGVANGAAGPTTTAMVGVIDATTLIYGNSSGIFRSTNTGSSWSSVSSQRTQSRVPVMFKGVCYLATASGLLVSKDKGATWAIQGASVNFYQGPFFGVDENTMVVVGTAGVFKTVNGGTSWSTVCSPYTVSSGAFDVRWWGGYTWDPVNNSVYATSMNNSAYRNDLPATSVLPQLQPAMQMPWVAIEKSQIRSSILFDQIQILSLAGKIIYNQHITQPVTSVYLPQLINARQSQVIIKLSTAQAGIAQCIPW